MKKFPADIPDRRVTEERDFLNRRQFVSSSMGALAGVAFASQGELVPQLSESMKLQPPLSRPDRFPSQRNPDFPLPEHVDQNITPQSRTSSHNNFYEFLPGYGGQVWKYATEFTVEDWRIEVTGACAKPYTLDLDDLFASPHEERLYHFRCVEKWAMNVPWTGFPLGRLIEKAQPTAKAKYVRFVSAMKPDQMPGIEQAPHYPWPYREALRMDEAMHELTFVATGVYGKPLLKQHGSPARIVVPWKYGYKNPKSIVRIEFVEHQPSTFWMVQPHEYGFLSNVNPYIPHPRWSQKRSYWVGAEKRRFKTPIFNGYERYVASLYPDEPRSNQKPLKPGQIAR